MGLLSWLGWPETPEVKSSPEEILADIRAGISGSLSGQTVTLRKALEVTTVLACARVIAEGVAQVPWKLYQRTASGGRIEARDNPLFRVIHRRPNAVQTSFEFRETVILHAVLTGNAFVFVNRSVSGEVLELLPYDPGAVTVTRNSDMSLTYRLMLLDGQQITVPTANMWHLRGPSWDGWMGLDAIGLARNSIGLSMATEEFGSALFKNGARPGGLLTTEQALNPESIKRIKEAWDAMNAGSGNAMKTGILSGGMKYVPLSYNADEAQFQETRKQVAREICSAFRVNPIMIQMHEGSSSYSSVEQMFLAHLTHTLMPWFERFEQSAENNLLTDKEQKAGFYTKLEAKGLMRGTAKERAEFLQIMLQNGVVSRDEARASEDMDIIGTPEFANPQPAANLYGPAPQG